MSAFYQWITEIVLLILLAIVLELLLPNNAFQKYVKMVISLIIVLALLSPIMKLLDVEPKEIFARMSETKQDTQIKNSMNLTKSEIESGRAAYIHNIMVVDMKNFVQKELMKEYGLTIVDIKLKISEKKRQPIEHANVYLTKKENGSQESKNHPVEPVEPVRVTVGTTSSSKEKQTSATKNSNQLNDVALFLAKKWEIEPAKVTVYAEGGDIEQ